MVTRRLFLGTFAYPAAAAAAGIRLPSTAIPSAEFLERLRGYAAQPADAARDEDFWALVGQGFTLDRSMVNLNNGGVSPSPAFVQTAHKRHLDYSNTAPPPYALWRILEPQREGVRDRIARHWGVDPEEIALTRNSSESLQICQLGLDLARGDEVLTTTCDYPRMLTTFKQRERREGIILKQFQIPIPCEDDAEIVSLFERNITPKTRLILMSHIVNITGQILPVKAVVEMARRRGIPVIVDGAHALAHFAFKLPDLGCDYYGVSLHKWLFAPHGTGLLYVRRDKVRGLWPLMAAAEEQSDDIRKFEEIGTHPAAPYLAIGEALTFHQGIGDERKEARLRFLRNTWANRLLSHPSGRARLHTSLSKPYSCGIGTVQIDGLDTEALVNWLWDEHRILTVAIKHAEFEGIRDTPSDSPTPEELDRFCTAVEHAIDDGLPTP